MQFKNSTTTPTRTMGLPPRSQSSASLKDLESCSTSPVAQPPSCDAARGGSSASGAVAARSEGSSVVALPTLMPSECETAASLRNAELARFDDGTSGRGTSFEVLTLLGCEAEAESLEG